MVEMPKFFNEDCLETMAKMDDNSIDLTVTSPPYDSLRDYDGYNFLAESFLQELYRVTKDGELQGKGRRIIKDNKKRSNIWTYSAGKGKSTKDKCAHEHPAIFPESLAKDHILSWSNPSDLVYDPFVGSGTTAKMAWLTDRRFVGSEISSKYCNLAAKRIMDTMAFEETKLFR